MEDNAFITNFQREVAKEFFGLPESRGFLLAGGAALIAAGVVERDTDDLDFFGSRSAVDVQATKHAFVGLCAHNGWRPDIAIDTPEFVRLVIIDSSEDMAIDFGVDADPLLPPTMTFLGPTLSVEENAGRKTLALFGRWMPRDFVDVFALADLYGKQRLIELASERDAGFDVDFFAQALDQVTMIKPERFPISLDRLPGLVAFFTRWAAELRASDE